MSSLALNAEYKSIDKNPESLKGQYLTFHLAEETYGIKILKVQEIIGVLPITDVPGTSPYVRGVLNLRGRVIPIVDMRIKFQMVPKTDDELTVILVVNIETGLGSQVVGLLVDSVSEVVEFTTEQIEAPPEMISAGTERFISSIAKTSDMIVMLLDLELALGDQKQLYKNY